TSIPRPASVRHSSARVAPVLFVASRNGIPLDLSFPTASAAPGTAAPPTTRVPSTSRRTPSRPITVRSAAGLSRHLLAHGRSVRQDRVHLPRSPVGVVHPHLVLDRVATRHVLLRRRVEAVNHELLGRLRGLLRGGHLDAEMIERAAR